MSDRIFSVTASALRLRRAASLSSEVVASLPRGQLVARLDLTPRGPWYRVFADTPGAGAYVGYVDSRWLTLWSQAPVVAAPAPTERASPPPAPPAAPPAPPPPPRATVPAAPAPAPTPAPAPAPTPATVLNFVVYGAPLRPETLLTEAQRLGVNPAELWTVLEVETHGEGFFAGGAKHRLPRILFERHLFAQETGNAFNAAHPDISGGRYSNREGTPPIDRYGGYDDQYPRLVKAAGLNREAALKSVSWGMGQVLGKNHAIVGYSNVEAMVEAMRQSEDLQFRAFTDYLVSCDLVEALKNHRWDKVAEGYNGPAYKDFRYDKQLADKYAIRKDRMPDLKLRRVQAYLKLLGKYSRAVDGDWGPNSRAAVQTYVREKGNPVGPDTFAQKPPADFLDDLIEAAENDIGDRQPAWPL